MVQLKDKLDAIKADPSHDDNAANAMYLWVSNTGECYTKIMVQRSLYKDQIIPLNSFIHYLYVLCLDERQALQNAEEDLGHVNHASCMGAALNLAHYYLNVYSD